MQKYSKEVKEFISSNIEGRSTEELVKLVNEKFDADFTISRMKAYKGNNKLKSGSYKGNPKGYSPIFSTEMQSFIKDHSRGLTAIELTDLLNERFSSSFKVSQIRTYKKNHNITSGIDAKFAKGNVPPNKGRKGYYSPGAEKGWFKPGSTPHNHKPVGSERVDSRDGYTLIKIAEPNVWELKHKIIYEGAHGKVPDGHVITFLDGDKTNLALENLQLVTMAERLMLTKSNLRFEDAELTKTGILIAKVKCAKYSLKRNAREKCT